MRIKGLAPVDLGQAGLNIRVNRTGNRYIEEALKRKFGAESFKKKGYGLLENKRISLVVE